MCCVDYTPYIVSMMTTEKTKLVINIINIKDRSDQIAKLVKLQC